MNDKTFQTLIDETFEAKQRYLALLDRAEDEYERRFGVSPSDIDDDYWIDAMHYPSTVRITVKKVEDSVRLRTT